MILVISNPHLSVFLRLFSRINSVFGVHSSLNLAFSAFKFRTSTLYAQSRDSLRRSVSIGICVFGRCVNNCGSTWCVNLERVWASIVISFCCLELNIWIFGSIVPATKDLLISWQYNLQKIINLEYNYHLRDWCYHIIMIYMHSQLTLYCAEDHT